MVVGCLTDSLKQLFYKDYLYLFLKRWTRKRIVPENVKLMLLTLTDRIMVSHKELLFNSKAIDLFADTVAILISVVSNTYMYYGMPRGHVGINLPPEHPIMSFETMELKMPPCKNVCL